MNNTQIESRLHFIRVNINYGYTSRFRKFNATQLKLKRPVRNTRFKSNMFKDRTYTASRILTARS